MEYIIEYGGSTLSRALSASALRSVLSPNSDANLIILLTLTGGGITTPIRICDNYTQRISETDENEIYGVVSRGNTYTFLPMQIALPTEESGSLPRANITMYDVTRLVLPSLRQLTGPPSVLIEIVLSTSVNTLEADFAGMKLAGVTYTKDSITGQLVVDGLETEPFPSHAFLPSSFPGLF